MGYRILDQTWYNIIELFGILDMDELAWERLEDYDSLREALWTSPWIVKTLGLDDNPQKADHVVEALEKKLSKMSVSDAIIKAHKNNVVAFSKAAQYTDDASEILPYPDVVEHIVNRAYNIMILEGEELENALKGMPSPLIISDCDWVDFSSISINSEIKLAKRILEESLE